MFRRRVDDSEGFRKYEDSHYTRELVAALRLTKHKLISEWDALERQWKEHEERLAATGVVGQDEGVLRLNVGGSIANLHRSLLGEAAGFQGSRFQALFEGVWDERVPRDGDGRYVLDESPTCLKFIIHTLLDSCTTAPAGTKRKAEEARDAVPATQEAYLQYIAHVLDLSAVIPTYPKGMKVIGGSTIAGNFDLPRWSACIRDWCPGNPTALKLVYRASRDEFSGKAFRDRAVSTFTDEKESLILVRVRSTDGKTESVVGGYSDCPWAWPGSYGDIGNGPQKSLKAFVFLLDSSNARVEPVKWGIKHEARRHAVYCYKTGDTGPCFGNHDLRVNFVSAESCTLQTGRDSYDVEEGSPFLAVDGGTVTEVEVFSVCSEVPREAPCLSSTDGTPWQRRRAFREPAKGREMEAELTQKFGASIAGLLMEEQLALAYAQAELKEAETRAATAIQALTFVYGPSVAAGAVDAVVELSIRGVPMTTLRSTLQACPDSVFATWFGERWPAKAKDVDEQGRFKVDCDPSCFSKILDVMRMQKRASWTGCDEALGKGGRKTARVSIADADRAAFAEAVDMYFPGCTDFVMDCVDLSGSPAPEA